MEEATIQLARGVAQLLTAWADAMAAEAVSGAASDRHTPVTDEVPVPAVRGPRQKEVVDLLIRISADGLKTSAIAREIGMEQPNAYLTLKALVEQDIVELVPGSDPQRWRLVERYRSRRQILDAAAMVRSGEVTTYGDISQLVYGHPFAGLAVGRVASTSPDFPNAHRVLALNGLIPDGWQSADGAGGVEVCIERLEAEGVQVDQSDDGRRYVTPPTIIVGWADLQRRLDENNSE